MEWMTLDAVGRSSQVRAEAFEEHRRRIDSGTSCRDDAFSKSIKVGLIES
jgi:hypothetical protein